MSLVVVVVVVLIFLIRIIVDVVVSLGLHTVEVISLVLLEHLIWFR